MGNRIAESMVVEDFDNFGLLGPGHRLRELIVVDEYQRHARRSQRVGSRGDAEVATFAIDDEEVVGVDRDDGRSSVRNSLFAGKDQWSLDRVGHSLGRQGRLLRSHHCQS